MRSPILAVVIAFGLALAVWPQPGRTQSSRDFVFSDTDGHLVIRYAGIGAGGLDPSQRYEILNAEFSTMVHDRLHADLDFQDEPFDPAWARQMEPLIEEHVRHIGLEISSVRVECRAAACRVIMEQPGHRGVAEHQAMLDPVEESLEAFVSAHRDQFEPGLMITAYDQEHETSHFKAFLRRAGHEGGPAVESATTAAE